MVCPINFRTEDDNLGVENFERSCMNLAEVLFQNRLLTEYEGASLHMLVPRDGLG